MTTGKIVNLCVRPQQAANLGLAVGGIVEEVPVKLGQIVAAFDFSAFYGSLGDATAADPAVLEFDSDAIAAAPSVAASRLLYLRAESRKAMLDGAIAARANAYYGKYANQAAIIARMQAIYDPASVTAKPYRLSQLSMIAESQYDNLHALYHTEGRLGVVKVTTSDLTSTTESTGEASSFSIGSQVGTSSTQTVNIDHGDTSGYQDQPYSGQWISDQNFEATASTDVSAGGETDTEQSMQTGRTSSSGTASQAQTMVNTDYGYRMPDLEAEAINQRAQVSLIDEQFSQFMFGQNLPNLDHVFSNELKMIDLNVKHLQVAYLDTILLSPIDGAVTAVTKNPGDSVAAGQALIRVENNASIYLVGTVIYRGMITAGSSTATVQTTAFGDPGSTTTINGLIVAAQGHETEDNRWDIVVSCSNLDANGVPVFPLHYGFDYDDTSIVIS